MFNREAANLPDSDGILAHRLSVSVTTIEFVNEASAFRPSELVSLDVQDLEETADGLRLQIKADQNRSGRRQPHQPARSVNLDAWRSCTQIRPRPRRYGTCTSSPGR
jgi:hypothetical protein